MMEEHGKKEEWFLEFLHRAEQLKCALRHSWTSSGRRESVAEHSWRLGLAAWLLKEEFPQIDLERLLELCLLHDLGEAVTGDVPCFEKEAVHEREEERAVKRLAEILPEERIRTDEPMKMHTTFRVGGPADYFLMPWRRLLARAQVRRHEYDALMGLCRQVRNKLDGGNKA